MTTENKPDSKQSEQEIIDKFESELIAELDAEDVSPQDVPSDSVPPSEAELDEFMLKLIRELDEESD